MKKLFLYIYILTTILTTACKPKDQNKVSLEPFLIQTGTWVKYIDGEVDTAVIPNCGTASPATTTTTTGSTTTGTTTGTASATNTVFTIYSPLIIKNAYSDTKESLNIRFTFDFYQSQGAIDPQQGFVMNGNFIDSTGKMSNNTVMGNKGTVKWPGFVGTIQQKCSVKQALQYFGLEINLSGFFIAGGTATTTPNTCNTTDNVNCTSSTTTTTTCFTLDNRTCMVVNTGGTPILIQGTIKCNHPSVVATTCN